MYENWNLIAELDGENAVLKTYVWGTDLSGSMQGAGGVGGLLNMTDHVTGNSYFYLHDGNGNVVGLVDSVSGALVKEYEYGPFGEVSEESGDSGVENNFKFSTKYTDSETGLIYYGHRYYSSETGRWISRDPIEERGGLNLYGFVGNDGINRVDMLGLSTAQSCAEKLYEIVSYAKKMLGDLIKYDPIQDARGGHIHGHGITRPFGHYDELKDFQNGLRNRLRNFVDNCLKNKPPGGTGSIRFPRWVDRLQNLNIPRLHFVYTDPTQEILNELNTMRNQVDSILPEIISYDSNRIRYTEPGDDTTVGNIVKAGAAVGSCYVIYRVVRFVPSLIAWPTIPLNLVVP